MLPTEVLTEIFKTYAECNPMDLEHGASGLVPRRKVLERGREPPRHSCGTNISFSSPSPPAISLACLSGSSLQTQKIDVLIDLRHPDEDHPEFDEHKAHLHRANNPSGSKALWLC
jgi:hypothetical protein